MTKPMTVAEILAARDAEIARIKAALAVDLDANAAAQAKVREEIKEMSR